MAKYINPKSLTFWAGAASLGAGAALGLHDVYDIGGAGDVLRLWVGPVGPHVLIANGLGLIGIRKAIAEAQNGPA